MGGVVTACRVGRQCVPTVSGVVLPNCVDVERLDALGGAVILATIFTDDVVDPASAADERAEQKSASATRRSLLRRLIELWISVFISVIAFCLFWLWVCCSLSTPGNSGRSSRNLSKRLNFSPRIICLRLASLKKTTRRPSLPDAVSRILKLPISHYSERRPAHPNLGAYFLKLR